TIGVLDAGRAIWEYNTVAFLARDGARYGTVHTSSDTQTYVRTRCASLLSDPCPSAPNFTVSVTPATCGATPTPPIVSVTDRFQAVTPLLANLWGSGPLALTATSRMYVAPGGCGS